MPRLGPTPDPSRRLDDSVNVPINRRFKRRMLAMATHVAKRDDTRVALTAYARRLLQRGLAQDEKRYGASTAELAEA